MARGHSRCSGSYGARNFCSQMLAIVQKIVNKSIEGDENSEEGCVNKGRRGDDCFVCRRDGSCEAKEMSRGDIHPKLCR
jgi:hypothetical protein